MTHWRVSSLSISHIFFVNTTKDQGRNGYILLLITQKQFSKSVLQNKCI